MGSKLLTARQAAERLTISTATVWALAKKGKLPNIKISDNVTRWEESKIEEFIASLRQQPL